MFKNLLQFWKGKDFLTQVLEEFKNMLDDAEIMFSSVCKRLINNEEEPGLKDKIYDIDKKVNDLQRDIRKRVVEHLAIQPSVDVSTSLLLMSVVKDAERLGDYAKNLYQRLGYSARQCIECGDCEQRCPFNLPISNLLMRAAETLEDDA